ncbi:MAG: glycoside hydrolase family 3 N-terminal domain-containing protein [Chloroflexota bacterium]|nr:glycoside hydrolase family 3 N-terminal domain-containing protein [Chloroflexota bacterium]
MLYPTIWRGVLCLVLLLTLFCPVVPPVEAQHLVEDPILQAVQSLSTRMKVGQLVLVSFPGTSVEAEDAITTLIEDYAVGGVLLSPQNGNFGAGVIAASDFFSLTQKLQKISSESPRNSLLLSNGITPYRTVSLPLFMAVNSTVASLPITSLISGTTALPTPLALGATWTRALAEAAGQVAGEELAALGVNFLLGPSLDVLAPPSGGDPAGLGTSILGGDPYWVGELGRSYIRGLHQGSDARLAVIPTHFPGIGSSDRPFATEIPTIQKSWEQLQQFDLPPFYAAMGNAPGAVSVADGVLVPHVRYSALQENIRSSTRPVSLDAQALQPVIAEFATWREGNGLLVVDNLGAQSLRFFDDPQGLTFNTRRIAHDALLVGNDLLIMDHFAATGDWEDHFVNIKDTLDFLAQSYENDPTFQARVDEALYRILSLKLRLTVEGVFPAGLNDGVDRESSSINTQVAMRAITRLAPLSDAVLPVPPEDGDNFVIFTQERPLRFVEGGVARPTLSYKSVGQTLQLLYGAQGTNQVAAGAVQQFTFQELLAALKTPLSAPVGGGNAAEEKLSALWLACREANWIIFAVTDLSAETPDIMALAEFLEQEAQVLAGKLVVLNFGVPYGLDSTDVSKLALYYALYSPEEAFVQAGVRALFGGLPAAGHSPLSIPALNYNLAVQTEPAAEQVISLSVVTESGQEMTPEEERGIRKDDVIYLRTSVIIDRNGLAVPDGTAVEFILTYPQENRVEMLAAETEDGVAFVPITLDRIGQLDITVKSGEVVPFFHLQLTIREGQSVIMISTTPTPKTTEAPNPTSIPVLMPLLPAELHLPVPQRGYLLGWGLLGWVAMGLLGFASAFSQQLKFEVSLRVGLWGGIGSLLGYILVVSSSEYIFPGGIYWLASREIMIGGVTACCGGLVLLALAISKRYAQPLWRQLVDF